MKKLFLFFILLSLIILIYPNSKVFAEQQKTQRWFCPKSVLCSDIGANCSTEGIAGHRVKISSVSTDSRTKPLTGVDNYIVECLATPSGQKCTTGKDDLDKELKFCEDQTCQKSNLKLLEDIISYKRDGGTNGFFKSDGKTAAPNPINVSSGTVSRSGLISPPLEWESFTPQGVSRQIRGVNLLDDDQVAACRQTMSQTECTFPFQEVDKVCGSIRWDPYGRVFDSQSLEPISGASVSLLKKNEKDAYEEFRDVPNPITTTETGEFSFIVPNGIYRLTVSYDNFSFPFDPSALSPNYSRAYSDIYYATSGANFKRQDIRQSGAVVHVDVPLDTSGVPYTTPVKLIGYSVQADKTSRTNQLILEGRASHPFTKVKAYTKETNVLLNLNSITADNLGNFRLTIDQSSIIPPASCCDIILEKVDLNSASVRNNKGFLRKIYSLIQTILNIPKVQAESQTTSFNIEPIPNFVDGYAYDNNNKIIPFAKVGVYLTFSNSPYYQTQADNNGYFKIGSSKLPSLPYTLRFSSSTNNQTINKTPSKFIKENSVYLTQNKISLYTYDKVDNSPSTSITPIYINPTDLPTTISPNPTQKLVISGFSNNETKPTGTNIQQNAVSPNGSYVLIIAILLALVGSVGGILAFYFLKKRKADPFNN